MQDRCSFSSNAPRFDRCGHWSRRKLILIFQAIHFHINLSPTLPVLHSEIVGFLHRCLLRVPTAIIAKPIAQSFPSIRHMLRCWRCVSSLTRFLFLPLFAHGLASPCTIRILGHVSQPICAIRFIFSCRSALWFGTTWGFHYAKLPARSVLNSVYCVLKRLG